MASLTSLLDDLIRTLPHLEGGLPEDTATPTVAALPKAERSQVRGIVGALHLDPKSIAPGPGFDWRQLREALD
jgi:N-acetyl-anhydromuramyl-L-alanine amidase AmpD